MTLTKHPSATSVSRRSLLGGLLAFGSGIGVGSAESAQNCVSGNVRPDFSGFHFGWVRDLPQQGAQTYEAPKAITTALPNAVDLRSLMPAVYDQGQLGSCTSNSIAGAVQYVRKKDKQGPDFIPSRLFIYYNGRYIEGTIPLDMGLRIQDGVGSLETWGVCSESDWPYDAIPADPDTHKFPSSSRAAKKPTDPVFTSAYTHRALSAWRVMQRSDQLKGCLAEGYPFIFGFTIYPSFFGPRCVPQTVIPLPQSDEKPTPVGHAVVCVGYDDQNQQYICRNSWGLVQWWGPVQDHGHFYMPYGYLENANLASDFWTIRTINALR
jgi:C1A family cysteine protease